VNKISVVTLQRVSLSQFRAAHGAVFAYNEVPAIAVANRLLVQGASSPDAPFFLFDSI
jgi:hypothetical protein